MLYHPSGAGQTIASNFPVSMEQQSAVAGVNNRTEVTASPVFSIGAWHRMEFVLQLNTIGQANGVFRWWIDGTLVMDYRSEEHTSELQSHSDLVCRLLLEKKKTKR